MRDKRVDKGGSNWFKSVNLEKKKSILVMVFYFIFFVILIIFIRSNRSPKPLSPNVQEQEEQTEPKGLLSTTNYHFTYKLKIDNVIYTYDGKRFNDKELFTISSGFSGLDSSEYYRYGELVLVKKANDYVLSSMPYYYFNYFDTNLLNKIINNSVYDQTKDQYVISTQNLSRLIDANHIINSSSENYLSIQYTNKRISAININFTNYVKDRGESHEIVELELNYNNHGNITDFALVK